mgnify:CR=1 FL=1
MDFVPSSTRARWKALESISMFGWCGSAGLGGFLADQPGVGYVGTFKYTAALQALGTITQFSLVLVVPLFEKASAARSVADDDATEGVAVAAGKIATEVEQSNQQSVALAADEQVEGVERGGVQPLRADSSTIQ